MNVVVVATHPDDETLGCGGTLLKHKASNDKIYWIIVTKMTQREGFSNKAISNRKEEIRITKKLYGFQKVYELGISTTCLDRVPKSALVRSISHIFSEIKPDTVYLPFMGDPHSDHRLSFDAAYSCTKVFRHPYIKKILMMEALSETEFSPGVKEFVFFPNYFVDVSKFLSQKLKVMRIFSGELGIHPFPRSEENIRALATLRGSQAGCRYAEGFMLLKYII